jgi:Tfp pilus assembly protein PilF
LRSTAVGVAAGLLFLPLLPVLVGVRVFRFGDLAHDRYLYLPSVGLCLLVGLGAKRLAARRNATRYVLAPLGTAVLIVLVWLNVTQQSFYRDDESFYRRGLQIGPSNALVMDFLGNYYMRQKQPQLALEQFKRASVIEPENANAQFTYAKGLFETKQYEVAEPYFIATAQSTGLSEERRELSTLCLAQIQIHMGNLSRAEETLLGLQSVNPSHPLLHDTLGTLYEVQGRLSDAQREYVSEFKISGTPASREKAIRLSRFLRSQQ